MPGNFKEEGTQLSSSHSACRSVFSISLSTAALRLSGGSSMLTEHVTMTVVWSAGPSDNAHGGVNLSCASMRSVCDE